MIKISVIVPVYNKQDTLARCIRALIEQTLPEIEIILIDDGSMDESKTICDEFAKQDVRIKVITKRNGGASSARNVGIRAASGDYLMFVDADDYIELDACEQLYKKAIDHGNIDIVVGNRIYHASRGGEKKFYHSNLHEKQIFTGPEFLLYELEKSNMYFVVVAAIYRRHFILNENCFFKEGIFEEDEDWVPRIFLLAKKIVNSNVLIYHHCETENSVMKRDRKKHDTDYMELCLDLDYFIRNHAKQNLVIALENRMFNLYLESAERSLLWNDVLNKRFVWRIAHGTKNYIKAIGILINKNLYFYLLMVAHRRIAK